jgi:putative transferase (TIGR04331 family)
MPAERVLLVKTDAQTTRAPGPVMHLGPWCTEVRANAGRMRTFPHVLEDFASVDRLHALSSGLFDAYSAQLATLLNQAHRVSWSVRAWQIVIGPWLTVFLDVVIDRFETLRKLRHHPCEFWTGITEYGYAAWASRDTVGFTDLAAQSDAFNEWLFGALLCDATGARTTIASRDHGIRPPDAPAHTGRRSLRRALLGALGLAGTTRPRAVTFVDSYFAPVDQAVLEFRLRQLPRLDAPAMTVPDAPTSVEQRRNLAVQSVADDGLNRAICRLMPELLPKAYLEDFDHWRDSASRHFPATTRLIVTAHLYSYNEGFRFWAASQVDAGAKVMAVQHGGGYGPGLRWSALDHELRVADFYATSGWVASRRAVTMPMPLPKLATSRKQYAATLDNAGHGMWVWSILRRFPFRIAEGAINTDNAEYLEDQRTFGRALDPAIRRRFTLRLRTAGNSWGEADLARSEFPDMVLDEFDAPFRIAAKGSRLWVITYNSTTLLEALVANVPFVAFWNSRHSRSRLAPAAEPLFERLSQCAVFHTDPASAARTVNEHFADPARWWAGADIQEARHAFCEHYALTSDNWLDVWATTLKDLLR